MSVSGETRRATLGNRVLGLLSVVVVTTLLSSVLVQVSGVSPATAATASQFDPGYIISDAKFYDGSALTASEVQAVLESKVRSCRATSAGPTCLRYYSAPIGARAARSGRCKAIAERASASAAEIIQIVGEACGVSQKALLILLEKEQGLVTSAAPSQSRYRIAMGFGCPDTAACDTAYYGFFNQLYSAAAQFKSYAATAASWNYRAGRTNAIQYHPNAACGTKPVYIRNQATAGLYIYTPYTPNAASLANPYGSGDTCSSYGNRNFWRLYTDWFGSTTDGSSPIGRVDSIAGLDSGEIRVTGWTLDRDVTESIKYHVYLDGVQVAEQTADRPRPDVDAVYSRNGGAHGFDFTLAAKTGQHEVCVWGIDSSGDPHTQIGCLGVATVNPSPYGDVNAAVLGYTGAVSITGWAIDPETVDPVAVHVHVDGTGAAATTASVMRPDVAAAYPAAGPGHGFDVTVPVGPGDHRICAYGLNLGKGTDVQLGCRVITVPPRSPFGDVSAQNADYPGHVVVSGWAIDPDTRDAVAVHVYADGVGAAVAVAASSRPDVGQVYPAYGADHGWQTAMDLTVGAHTVCAYGIDVGPGDNAPLGCTQVVVPPRSPFGDMRAVPGAGSDQIAVSGWAIDAETMDPIDVHVYVDGQGAATTRADGNRADVEARYPGLGIRHGYSVSVAAARGSHTVCAYAINVGSGDNTSLGCTEVATG
jgi:hypothetical protein